MAERISAAPAEYPFCFVVAGDSGAWPDPTGDAVFAQLLRQTAELEPVFFAQDYLRVIEALPAPDVCVVGNHDLDDPGAREAWAEVHGPVNFEFAHGHTRFIAIDAAPGAVGEVDIDPEHVAASSDLHAARGRRNSSLRRGTAT